MASDKKTEQQRRKLKMEGIAQLNRVTRKRPVKVKTKKVSVPPSPGSPDSIARIKKYQDKKEKKISSNKLSL